MEKEYTLCWDCRCSTTGECRWSRRLKPVKGWDAVPSKEGWLIKKCPEFARDSWGAGRFRTEKEYLKFIQIHEENKRKKEEREKMNKLTIIGNLTSDPETRTTTTGKSVCTFGVAVNRRDKANQQEADFFRVSAWSQLGENCQKYLAKGRKVAVVGPVSVHTYTDKQGNAKASLEVTAQDVEFLSPKSDSVDQQTGYTKVIQDELPWQ